MNIDKLDGIVNKYNNTDHSTIKMKPVGVKSSTCIDSSDIVRISKYKNTFPKGYVRNWSENVFAVKKVKSTVPWTYAISDLNGEEIVGMFYENELQKSIQKEFRVEKVIKKKVINYMFNRKATIVLFTVGLIKKACCKRVDVFQNQNL